MTSGTERSSVANDWTTTRAPAVARPLHQPCVPSRGRGGPRRSQRSCTGSTDGTRRSPAAAAGRHGRATSPPPSSRATARRSNANATALPGVDVVERGDPRVEAEPGGDGRGRDAQQLRRAAADPGELRRELLDGVGVHVDRPRADPLRRLARTDRPAQDDGVGVAVGPHRRRPRLELRIALQPDLVLACRSARCGTGRSRAAAGGRRLRPDARRQQDRERHRELVEEVAVGLGQVEARRCPPRRRPRSHGTGRTRAGGRRAPSGSR